MSFGKQKISTMITYTIDTMTCGHCVGRITRAVQAIDADAKLEADLPSHRLQIDSHLEEAVIRQALSDAGYPPSIS